MSSRTNHDLIIEFLMKEKSSYYRLAYNYVHNKEDALDIVQDAICKALSTPNTPNLPEAVKPWFYRIVVNTALDFIRKNKRQVLMEEDILEAVAPSQEDKYEDVDLKEAIEKLPIMSRTIILLRFYEDLKLDEIARILDENINTTKSRLYAALRKLKLALEDYEV